jgi:hypothetical protein
MTKLQIGLLSGGVSAVVVALVGLVVVNMGGNGCGKAANSDAEKAAAVSKTALATCLKTGMSIGEAQKAIGFEGDLSTAGPYTFVRWNGLEEQKIIATFDEDKLVGKMGKGF